MLLRKTQGELLSINRGPMMIILLTVTYNCLAVLLFHMGISMDLLTSCFYIMQLSLSSLRSLIAK